MEPALRRYWTKVLTLDVAVLALAAVGSALMLSAFDGVATLYAVVLLALGAGPLARDLWRQPRSLRIAQDFDRRRR